jgi:hypothetical protein
MQRKIVKVKITKEDKVHTSYSEIIGDEGESDVVTREGGFPAHPDLVGAMASAKIHLATLAEYGSMTEFEDEPSKLDKFHVTGITLAGDDEHAGVVITGMRILQNNKVLNLNSPFVKLNPDHSDYAYASSLEMVINEILTEADQYLNGKHAPSPQLNLFENTDPETEEQEEGEEEAKPKATRKRSKKLPKEHPIMKAMGDDANVEVTVEV